MHRIPTVLGIITVRFADNQFFLCYFCSCQNYLRMFAKFINKFKTGRLSMRMKFTLSLSAIAAMLLVSSIISIMEYSRMSHYVSSLIADNIYSINVAEKLANASNDYNLSILKVIGDTASAKLPAFNQTEIMAHCDSLRESLAAENMITLADSVKYSYSAYMLTSLELKDVLLSDFIDARAWYFQRLQPKYNRLRSDIEALNSSIYNELKKNSVTFDRGFYRSVIPGIVAVSVGLLLILLFYFFIMVYYIHPLNKMLGGIKDYQSFNRHYNYTFEGDDQLSELNNGIAELTEENQQLNNRIHEMRDSAKKDTE